MVPATIVKIVADRNVNPQRVFGFVELINPSDGEGGFIPQRIIDELDLCEEDHGMSCRVLLEQGARGVGQYPRVLRMELNEEEDGYDEDYDEEDETI
jgi:hypothetical protein